MKNIFLFGLLVTLSLFSYSQKLDAKNVPQAVKDAFKKAHSSAAATWEKEDGDYEANFKENGIAMSCVIDKKGTILETESAIKAEALPAGVQQYMDEHYKGKKWKEVAKIVKANGEVNYEVNAGTDVLFDANGNHIQKKEKED